MKDINFWRKQGFEKFKAFVSTLSKGDTKRQLAARIKASSDDILTVKKTDDIHLFIPLSKGASCFHGSGTNWCISTKSGENYFFEYMRRYNSVVFLLNTGDEVYALVMDDRGYVSEVRDSENKLLDTHIFLSKADITHGELRRFIENNRERISKAIDKDYSDELERGQALHLKTPESAYSYAVHTLNGRFIAGEPLIAMNPMTAYFYSVNIINGRWPEGEEAIIKYPIWAVKYAAIVLKGRWPEAERIIASHPVAAYRYATNVIRGRWPEGEEAIMSREDTAKSYTTFLKVNTK